MDFSFTEEQEMWRKTMQDFTEKEAGREYTRMCDLEPRYPQELWDAGVKQGFLGLLIPQEYGGMGADAIMFTIFVECLAKYSYEMASVFHVPMFSATNVVDFGTKEQQEKYLPRFIRGEQRFSISMTEPEAGSDAASITTSAVLQDDHFLVNGQKQFSTGGHLPGNIMVMSVKTDKNAVPPRNGISVILVPNDLPGLELTVLPLIARRAIGTCSVFLNDVKVPRENLLGELNGGWKVLGGHLEWERQAVCAACCGESQSTLDDVMDYAKQRVQFGQTIGKFQDVGHRLVDLWCELQAVRSLTYRIAWMITEHIPCVKEVSAGKMLTTELLDKCAIAGMEFMGGYSLLPDSDFERHWRNARYLLVGGGATEVQRFVLSRLLGLR